MNFTATETRLEPAAAQELGVRGKGRPTCGLIAEPPPTTC